MVSAVIFWLKIWYEVQQCVKHKSLPPCHFYGKMPYSRIRTRTLKSAIYMIIRIQYTTLLLKKLTSTFIITPAIAFPILHFWAYKRNYITLIRDTRVQFLIHVIQICSAKVVSLKSELYYSISMKNSSLISDRIFFNNSTRWQAFKKE